MSDARAIHEYVLRVFYEDTDMAGIVYYANYLKFIERARSTMVREADVDQRALAQSGLIFAVRKVVADYHASAQLDDQLIVKTQLLQMSGAKMIFSQNVFRMDELLFSAEITVACVKSSGAPTRIPSDIRAKLQQFAAHA
ncbi:tol-pal system-associated acyl-CoA thioesterase [Amylibacter marinus]|uniref:Tol-pal system-associated acyl-CoA thioesterase n=1 Tax=Amylibacter marinus TaxID=1475483 RepID=A0ABQ5VQU7_9RHOB|nr:tol-pal system-associated acyl-CoA thioesterase [Amylibacter marinus]GLQ33777.1 tol-pal system-associated acyl-CoA thioesterase [Amylibacter marinus]